MKTTPLLSLLMKAKEGAGDALDPPPGASVALKVGKALGREGDAALPEPRGCFQAVSGGSSTPPVGHTLDKHRAMGHTVGAGTDPPRETSQTSLESQNGLQRIPDWDHRA